jgi:dihydropteroate synthase
MDRWQLISNRALPDGVEGVRSNRGAWVFEWTGCALMGVVNTTPDSFSDGGSYLATDAAIAHARQLVADGAHVVDIGGESTRPGADDVALDVELQRTIPVIEQIAADESVVISVDTRKPQVAAAAVAAGAHIVNDVGGLRDPAMVAVCAELGVPVVVMHMRGTPTDMQIDPRYVDVVAEVTEWLLQQASVALAAGIPSVMLDPGIGFGKNLDHNVALFRALPLTDRFPVLIGASRKRTIQQLAGIAADVGRDAGSIAAHLFAAHHGAAMVRVHDVAGHQQAFAVDAGLDRD